ncbi:MAG: phage minor head protein [Burkholderiales bacterium]
MINKWQVRRGQEAQFAAQIRKLARPIAAIVAAHTNSFGLIDDAGALDAAMSGYRRAIEPWARSVSNGMIARIDAGNLRAWNSLSKEIGVRLRSQITGAGIGQRIRELHEGQVALITSLPREAAARAQKLSQQAVSQGRRASEVAKDIAATEDVTVGRATLIARTEIAKTNSSITQARSESVGAPSYFWRTMKDQSVRPAHRAMEGELIDWADPPEVGDEGRHHAGVIYNCRCYPEPVLGGKFFA